MTTGHGELVAAQRDHWEATYTAHPHIYGGEPSAPARHAAELFAAAGARDVLEVGADTGATPCSSPGAGSTSTPPTSATSRWSS